jgi:Cu+-exporting ATPase
VAGYLMLGDAVKHSASGAVAALHARGIVTRLLSGDSRATTAAIARLTGMEIWDGEALPADKIRVIRELQNGNKTVAMVGDGVNDAPALAQADVGIAMSEGTEIAVQSASVMLLRDDLKLIPDAIDISRRTLAVIRQNLVWAFAYNCVGIIVAALGLLNPFVAAGAMVASSLSVVGNSMRLRTREGVVAKTFVEIIFPWIEPRTPGEK